MDGENKMPVNKKQVETVILLTLLNVFAYLSGERNSLVAFLIAILMWPAILLIIMLINHNKKPGGYHED